MVVQQRILEVLIDIGEFLGAEVGEPTERPTLAYIENFADALREEGTPTMREMKRRMMQYGVRN